MGGVLFILDDEDMTDDEFQALCMMGVLQFMVA